MDYFMQSQEKTFSSQMKDAVKLGPCIDEDNLIIDEVTLSEGLFHFACIGWKVIFALVPPPSMGGGVPAFFVALAFIGIVTMFVGEVATRCSVFDNKLCEFLVLKVVCHLFSSTSCSELATTVFG